ncbi:hypothetical protein OY671_011529, partial [Metschnikowia pulcherrima]
GMFAAGEVSQILVIAADPIVRRLARGGPDLVSGEQRRGRQRCMDILAAGMGVKDHLRDGVASLEGQTLARGFKGAVSGGSRGLGDEFVDPDFIGRRQAVVPGMARERHKRADARIGHRIGHGIVPERSKPGAAPKRTPGLCGTEGDSGQAASAKSATRACA